MQEATTQSWTERPIVAGLLRFVILLVPIVSAFALAFAIGRLLPPSKVGLHPIVWWVGVFSLCTLYIQVASRLSAKLLPVAALFRLSMIFPDEAPSRFKSALRATSSKRALSRLRQADQMGIETDAVQNSSTLVDLLAALGDHDRLTRGHAERVQAYADLIAEELNLSTTDRAMLRWGTLLHDMGKLDVPAEILNKAGRPDEQEWKILQTHPAQGRGYVDSLRPWLGDWLGAVDEHHCRWDGTGYPSNLAGEDITLAGRIAAVADAYDVMTSVRSYKKAMSAQAARQEVADCAGTQFDPAVVRAFLRISLGQLRLVAGPISSFTGTLAASPAPIAAPVVGAASAAAAVAIAAVLGLNQVPEPKQLAFTATELVVEDGAVVVAEDAEGGVDVAVGAADTLEVSVVDGPEHGTWDLRLTEEGWRIDYWPDPDFNGTDEMVVRTCDATGQCILSTVPVTVQPTPDAPLASDDYYTTTAGQTLVLDVLKNDRDVDGDILTIVNLTGGVSTAFSLVDGEIQFVAPPAAGRYVASYEIDDGSGRTDVASVTVDVSSASTTPTSGQTTTSTLVASQTTALSTPVSSTTVSSTTGPTTTVSSTTTSQSTTTTSAPTTTSGPATTTTTVPQNLPPVAADDVVTTPEDTPITIAALSNDRDPEAQGLTLISVEGGTRGVASIGADGTVIYTPMANQVGVDQLTYVVEDSVGQRTSAMIEVTITPVNDAPVLADLLVEVDENRVASTEIATMIGADVDGDELRFVLVDQRPTALLIAPGGAFVRSRSPLALSAPFVVDPATGVVSTVQPLDFESVRSYLLTVRVTDGMASSLGVLVVNVNDLDETPTAVPDTATTDEDTPVVVSPLANDSDPEGQALSLVSAGPGLLGAVTTMADGTVNYAPLPNVSGTDSIPYVATDPAGNSVTGTITVSVVAVNDAPVAVADTAGTDEDSAVDVLVVANDSDPEGSILTVTSVVQGSGGVVAITAADTITYTPNPDVNGTDTFTYTIADGDGGFASATATVVVHPVNDPPLAAPDTVVTDEDVAIVIAVTENDTDPDSDQLNVSIESGPSLGSAVPNGDGTITYTPNLNANGNDTFSYTVSDGNGGAASATVAVSIAARNDAPIALPDSASTPEDNAVDVAVLVNDSDVDGDALSVTVGPASSGATVVNPDQTITYTPNPDTNGTDSFVYTVSDGAGGAASATVTVVVGPVDDPPVATDDTASTDEDVAVVVLVLDNDDDPEALALTVDTVGQGANGSVVIAADGKSATYTPHLDTNGSDSFSYSMSDPAGNVATATVTVNVAAVNDAPVAADDAATTDEDIAVVLDVLANDDDVDGDPLTVAVTTAPTSGSATVNGDNTITYTPDPDTNGTDSFVYTVSDGAGGASTASGTITVADINDPPVIAPTTNQSAFVNVAYTQAITHADPDGTVVSASVTGLPAGLTWNLGANAINITGTPTAATLDTTFPISVEVVDDDAATDVTNYAIVIGPVGLSPYAGLVVIDEVLYAESEPFDLARPFDAYLMDEYMEIRNTSATTIDLENFSVSDTADPGSGDDLGFHSGVPPYLPQHTGRVNQAVAQPTPVAPGSLISAPIRRPDWTSYQLQDGSLRPSTSYSAYWVGVDYGFPAGPNSNWEAFNNEGDDIWLWDPNGLLVDFVAWDDGSGGDHIASRPPVELGIWDVTVESRLASAGDGRSISRAGPGNVVDPRCWELTGSGDAAADGCVGATPTLDTDTVAIAPQPRVSSQGRLNQ